MQVKVFEAADMASALKKVKQALGPDALILSTRTVRKKGLSLLGKPITEITAAIDAPPHTRPANQVNRTLSSPSERRSPSFQEEDITYEDVWNNNNMLEPLANEVQGLKEQLQASNLVSLQNDIDELKNSIQDFTRGMADINKKLSDQKARIPVKQYHCGDGWLSPVTEELTRRGIKAKAAETIIRLAGEKLSPQQIESPKILDVFFKETIAGLLQVNGPILIQGPGQKRVALIGPTGVGKTTTIAKLAAAYLKNFGKNLALITIDTYRIAAAEQLRVYGEIMNLPVEVVLSPEDLQKAFDKHRNKKLILIDTAGHSPKDERRLKELSRFFRPDSGIENHLVLSATTREQELYQVVKRFRTLSFKSFIFTKLDECENLGALLNLHTNDNYPLSYLSNGQRVPEDLMLAEPERIACLIMDKPYNSRSINAINA